MLALKPIDQFSRRRLLGYGAASLALTPGLAEAQKIPPQTPATPPADDTSSRIATKTDAAQHLTINVMIAGKGPFRFVVDTGADRSVISDDIAVALGLVPRTQVTVQGVVRSVNTQTVMVSDISFGSVRKMNLPMPILPRALLGADGYLGLDAIDGSRVTLDFKNHVLLVRPPRHGMLTNIVAPNEALVPVRGSMGHLRAVNCRVDGVNATAFIDTGAEVSVGNSQLFNALVDHDPTYVIYGSVPLTGVTGGMIQGNVTVARHIRLNSVTFEQCTLVIADMQIFNIWELDEKPALLIGMNFLRQFAQVSIDYGRKEILFDLMASMVLARRT